MMKIPTLFKRGGKENNYHVLCELSPGCEWVLEGQGMITIKIDGMNVQVKKVDTIAGEILKLYKRLKPSDGEYSSAAYIPAERDNPNDQYLFEAFDKLDRFATEGIYEAYGPKINANPQKADDHYMVRVAPVEGVLIVPKTAIVIKTGPGVTVQEFFNSVRRELFDSPEIEGLVWQFEEPSMTLKKAAKIKRKDFGFLWPPSGSVGLYDQHFNEEPMNDVVVY